MPRPERGDPALSIGAPATFVDRLRPDGVIIRWESRRHRKHLKDGPAAGSTWWAPRSRGWWIAVLFAVGSLLFAVGSVAGYADAVGTRWDNVTFFIGSLFFTSAAFLTYREAVDAAPRALNPVRRRVSAVASYVNPVTGQVHNAGRASTQTLIGAACFFIGALLLLPERTEETPGQVTAPSADGTLAPAD